MEKKAWIVAAMTVLLAVQAGAMGSRPQEPAGVPPEKALGRITERLDLNEEQKARIRENSEKMEKEMKANREALKKVAGDLKVEMQKDAPDRARVRDHITKMNRLHNEMHIRRVDSLLDLKATLTPQQREKFKRMLEVKRKPAKRNRERMSRPGKAR